MGWLLQQIPLVKRKNRSVSTLPESTENSSEVVNLDDRRPDHTGNNKTFSTGTGGGGGGGGGKSVDTETKHYVDANMRAVSAENAVGFTKLEAKIDSISPGASWQQIAGIAAVSIGTVFAILAYASDRFDGGISAYGMLDSYIEDQRQVDQAQDLRLDRILTTLEAQRDQPQAEEVQD